MDWLRLEQTLEIVLLEKISTTIKFVFSQILWLISKLFSFSVKEKGNEGFLYYPSQTQTLEKLYVVNVVTLEVFQETIFGKELLSSCLWDALQTSHLLFHFGPCFPLTSNM